MSVTIQVEVDRDVGASEAIWHRRTMIPVHDTPARDTHNFSLSRWFVLFPICEIENYHIINDF